MRIKLIIFFLLTSAVNSTAQDFTNCKIFQFQESDSLDKILVAEMNYDSNGLLVDDYYNFNFKQCKNCGTDGYKSYNFYRDTFLITSKSIYNSKDSSKTLFYYNDLGFKVKTERYSYKRRIKKSANKGLGKSGGCIITESDYEKDKSWEPTLTTHYEYDKNGNLISEYNSINTIFPDLKYNYEYDNRNRIIKIQTLERNRIYSIEDYKYLDNGYLKIRTSYNYKGEAKHLLEENYKYSPQYKTECILNSFGKITREIVTTEKDSIVGSKIINYDDNGNIKRKTKYDEKGLPEITHIYEYE